MRYASTRGQAPDLEFDDVLLAGLAADGGLYVPKTFPRLDTVPASTAPYQDFATATLKPFFGDSALAAELPELTKQAYARFDHAAVLPLLQLDHRTWLLELFHGPTLAFKDVALQLLGLLFDRALAKRQRRMTVVGATSGDTGSAAMEALRDRANVDVVVLYPHGRTSEVQRRQMTTIPSANVHAVAVEGTFDDCQDMVKALFADTAFRDRHGLSAVNSINWARIAAQSAYYVAACARLGWKPTAFSVPTGNFGNVYAAYVARAMGAPVAKLVVGTNSNDILTRFFHSGRMQSSGVVPTLSPSMDIQVSSNFERLLFELAGRDATRVRDTMAGFRSSGSFDVSPAELKQATDLFAAAAIDDEATIAEIRRTRAATGITIDPHSAIGLAASRRVQLDPDLPLVSLACAHPAKFPDAVERATGERPKLPAHLADLFDRPERITILPNDLNQVRSFVDRVALTKSSAA
ncbi:threonine synthase [Roseiterribacter gracilis]|uniref:Threonine synthase n=1 Tax=Roseiterribacter gracilis TaxID=2812848 RepID=A0A8S8XGN3_9PROT|nr:threonine synthase [Rhodospirillales bacterium TMPK1]